ncbi:MAG: MFS transporter [Chloroflexi bacterium]|nr:MFS transporter [Chloroflexota bacterium]MCL5026954.1 MFS transporter [Chloroflexota bacterium]
MEASVAAAPARPGLLALARNRLLLSVTFGHLVNDVFANVLPMTYPLLMSTLHLNYGMVGLVGTLFICAGSLSQPFFGFLADRINTRYLAVFGIAWMAVLMSSIGNAWDYTSLVVITCLAALGNGAFHPQGAMNAARVGGRQRASGVSIFLLGGTLGFALGPLLTAAIIINWGLSGLQILLIPGLLGAAVVGTAMWRHDGRTPDSGPLTVRGQHTARHHAATSVSLLGLAVLVLIVAMQSWAYQSMVSYIPLLITGKQQVLSSTNLSEASRFLFLLLVGASIGMLTGGLLADRIGRIQTCASALVLTAPAMFLFLHTDGLLAIVLAMAAGLLIEVSHPITVVMAQEIMPRSAGLASGLILGLAFVTGGVGAFVTGVIADHTGLLTAMTTLTLFPMAAALLFLVLRRVSPQLSIAAD